MLECLPQLEPEVEHTPELDGLPRLVYNLALKVDWSSEQMCFRDVAEELACFCRLVDGLRTTTTRPPMVVALAVQVALMVLVLVQVLSLLLLPLLLLSVSA
jgi:hypothetical protein